MRPSIRALLAALMGTVALGCTGVNLQGRWDLILDLALKCDDRETSEFLKTVDHLEIMKEGDRISIRRVAGSKWEMFEAKGEQRGGRIVFSGSASEIEGEKIFDFCLAFRGSYKENPKEFVGSVTTPETPDDCTVENGIVRDGIEQDGEKCTLERSGKFTLKLVPDQ